MVRCFTSPIFHKRYINAEVGKELDLTRVEVW